MSTGPRLGAGASLHDAAVEEIGDLVAAALQHQSDPEPFLELHTDDVVIVNIAGRRVLGRADLAVAVRNALASPLADVTTTDDELDDDPRDAGAPGPAVARRVVAAPLRRWAAARAASRAPALWAHLFARARELDRRNAAAVMAGLLDAFDAFESPVQGLLIAEATRWPDQAVRRAGLTRVAEREGAEAALRLAEHDPNARVREWARSLTSAPPPGRATGTWF